MIALASSGTITPLSAQNADWLGTTSEDWNVDSNWSGGTGVNGKFAIINTSEPRAATISSDITAIPIDISIGAGEGFSGILNHPSGAGTTAGNWMIVSKIRGNRSLQSGKYRGYGPWNQRVRAG